MAAVDVFESEPILQGHPLLRLENAVCTPHIGYVEQESYEHYFSEAFNNIHQFLDGHPCNIVNPASLGKARNGTETAPMSATVSSTWGSDTLS